MELLKKGKNEKKSQYLEIIDNKLKIFKDKDCNEIKHEIKLNFNLSIEWLYLGKIEKTTKILPPLIGFTLQIEEKSKIWTYYSSNEQKLQELQIKLKKSIKQQKIQYYYEVIKKIGEGNFAFVYLIQHRWTKQLFAAKVFNKEKISKNPFGKISVNNEISILSELDHPNIVKLQQVFETENSIYLIMEYLEGISLLQAIQEKTFMFNEHKIAQLFKQIFSLLTYLNSKNIMHRDIKPENLIFHKEKIFKKLKLIDFGLAEYTTNEVYLFPRCGTPGFVAPEIISNKEMLSNYGCTCDLFSCGCILHLLLFKELLFKTQSLSELIEANKLCLINFEDCIYQTISLQAKKLLEGILAKNKEERWNAETALNSEFITLNSKKQNEINIMSLQQLDQQQAQQQQDISTSGKIKESSPQNKTSLIQQQLAACEKILDSSQKIKEEKKDSNNSISKHNEINYQTQRNQKEQKLGSGVQFSLNENIGYPKQVQKKKPLLKKSMFKFGTVNSEVNQKKEQEQGEQKSQQEQEEFKVQNIQLN